LRVRTTRIAIGGISHETSTFVRKPTTLLDFETGFGLFHGQEIIDRFTGSNICAGGFIDGAAKHEFDLVPLLWTFAYPSGVIVREAYETLKDDFLHQLQTNILAGPIDGVLLDMHGAMVVDGIDDGDGDFIAAVRRVAGPECPIIVTQDLHGNHSQLRVDQADAIIGFDTYPHVDMAERGREAVDLLAAMLDKQVRPVMALRQLPLFWNVICQVTAEQPMKDLIDRVHEMETRAGILSVTVATGFPWADVPDMGASVIVVADQDPALARAAADELGDWIWMHRRRWICEPVSVVEAIERGEGGGKYPIILADHADNTGGGSPGDSTEILQTFLDRNLQDALLLYMVDPEVVEQAHAAGVGRMISVEVGGKSNPVQGPPVQMQAEVMALSEGEFTYDGPMYAGLTGNMGRSAWLRQGGVSVVVVTSQEQPLGPSFARTLGIHCEAMKYIGVKSAAHFRAAFGKFAGCMINVDARAIQTHDFARLKYRKRTREFYPIEIGE
jgi:microcystin degradation protein MlrC